MSDRAVSAVGRGGRRGHSVLEAWTSNRERQDRLDNADESIPFKKRILRAEEVPIFRHKGENARSDSRIWLCGELLPGATPKIDMEQNHRRNQNNPSGETNGGTGSGRAHGQFFELGPARGHAFHLDSVSGH